MKVRGCLHALRLAEGEWSLGEQAAARFKRQGISRRPESGAPSLHFIARRVENRSVAAAGGRYSIISGIMAQVPTRLLPPSLLAGFPQLGFGYHHTAGCF